MEREYQKSDFRPMETLFEENVRLALPIGICWVRAINGQGALMVQTPKEHRHSFYELHFVLRGEMRYFCRGEEIGLGSGEMILFPPEESHRVSYYSEDFLKFSLIFVSEDGTLCEALRRQGGRAITISPSIWEALDRSVTEAERNTAYSRQIVGGRLFEIVYELAEIRERRQENEEKTDIRLVRAKQFIRDNSHVFLGCEDVASYCYISVKQLNRIFQRYEGVTLLSYIHREKLLAAEELLRENGISIQEISEALGFSSVYYFHAFFAKYRGITPRQYRQERT